MSTQPKSLNEYGFTQWLENTVKSLYEYGDRVEAIAVSATLQSEYRYSSYFNCDVSSKVLIAHDIYCDAILDTVISNADKIKKAIEDLDDDDSESEEM